MNKIRFSTRFVALAAVVISVCGVPDVACAQKKVETDSTVNKIRLNTLRQRRTELQKKIEDEDKKRNRVIEGVSAESLERMNMAQDSICLELRSELVGVELEIKELAPRDSPSRIIQQYNNLRQSLPQKAGKYTAVPSQGGKK